jgi:hypothetical protein
MSTQVHEYKSLSSTRDTYVKGVWDRVLCLQALTVRMVDSVLLMIHGDASRELLNIK